MATGNGVIQGYTGVAAVDAAHQIIVEAQAHGTGSEQEALLPVVTVEPVCANLCHNKGLTRFTLRGRAKVDGQWTLFCLVHTIETLAHAGNGMAA